MRIFCTWKSSSGCHDDRTIGTNACLPTWFETEKKLRLHELLPRPRMSFLIGNGYAQWSSLNWLVFSSLLANVDDNSAVEHTQILWQYINNCPVHILDCTEQSIVSMSKPLWGLGTEIRVKSRWTHPLAHRLYLSKKRLVVNLIVGNLWQVIRLSLTCSVPYAISIIFAWQTWKNIVISLGDIAILRSSMAIKINGQQSAFRLTISRSRRFSSSN